MEARKIVVMETNNSRISLLPVVRQTGFALSKPEPRMRSSSSGALVLEG